MDDTSSRALAAAQVVSESNISIALQQENCRCPSDSVTESPTDTAVPQGRATSLSCLSSCPQASLLAAGPAHGCLSAAPPHTGYCSVTVKTSAGIPVDVHQLLLQPPVSFPELPEELSETPKLGKEAFHGAEGTSNSLPVGRMGRDLVIFLVG